MGRKLQLSLDDYKVEIESEESDFPFTDLIAHLQKQKGNPKIYWSDRHLEEEKICWGAALFLNKMPKNIDANERIEFFVAQPFSKKGKEMSPWQDLPEEIFLLAENTIKRKGQNSTLTKHFSNLKLAYRPTKPYENTGPLKKINGWQNIPDQTTWQDLVNFGLKMFDDSFFTKVVLSRQSSSVLSSPICPFAMLRYLKQKQKNTTIFFLQLSEDSVFLGATPEKLYTREGDLLTTEALAGTLAAGKTLQNKEMDKLLKEVSAVEKFLEETLLPFALKIDKKNDFSIIEAGTLSHLYKKITATLKSDVSHKDILSVLHPTPAVCGKSKEKALSFIEENERHDRGYYAGPIGWIGKHHADISVAIRSALVRGNEAFLFAGAGIVQGSIPEKEWDELENKTAQIKEFFCG